MSSVKKRGIFLIYTSIIGIFLMTIAMFMLEVESNSYSTTQNSIEAYFREDENDVIREILFSRLKNELEEEVERYKKEELRETYISSVDIEDSEKELKEVNVKEENNMENDEQANIHNESDVEESVEIDDSMENEEIIIGYEDLNLDNINVNYGESEIIYNIEKDLFECIIKNEKGSSVERYNYTIADESIIFRLKNAD